MQLLSEKLTIFGQHDDHTIQQITRASGNDSVVRAALCPDGHLGYGIPIGGVVAYRDSISPTGVGYDIGCGNKAVLTDMEGWMLRGSIKPIMDDVWKIVSFGIGRKNDERVDDAVFEHDAWKLSMLSPLKEMAHQQLGTVGSGNHYVDLFTDEEDRVWIGVHFGSRGLGHKTATWFLKAAGAADGIDVEPCVLKADSALGGDYLQAMTLAGEYAYAGRNWVCDRVLRILGANAIEEVHNHHNFAWRETHGGEAMWVVRKGATPAFPGQKGFVGGTMGEKSVILEGVENENAKYSLYSTVHGAGRAMGRAEAKGTFDRKTGAVKRVGKVSQEMMDGWVKKAGIELRGAGIDESPDCYKRLDEVLAAVSDSVRILHTLTPVGVAMAGKETFDPFKD